MRRAALQALRAARRSQVRRLFVQNSFSALSKHSPGLRSVSSTIRKDGPPSPLQSSLYFRNFSIAALVSALGAGVWYYRAVPADSGDRLIRAQGSTTAPFSTISGQTNTLSPSITSPQAPLNPSSPQLSLESPRRALVVDDDTFYTGEIFGDEPLSKSADDDGRQVLEMLTPEQATQHLRRNEESYLVGRGHGVVRYDVVQLASNNPIEDDHDEKIIAYPPPPLSRDVLTPTSDWMFWGVFDGHSGWTTSAKLRQVLISFVARELNLTYKSALSSLPTPQSIDAAIKKGFLRLDHEIVHESVQKVQKANSRNVGAELLAPALSGSCALLSFYDSNSKLLRVACAGDSRAVLGRKGASGKWVATPLSEDLTGGTPSEMARLRAEHPGEDYVTRNGRILGGLEPSRAFGDASYKWSRDVQEMIKKRWFGRTPSQLLKTPPYVTAEPVVTTTKVEPEKGDFVVMATDGLWEMLTNEEVVGLVGQWLEAQPKGSTNPAMSSGSGSGSGSVSAWTQSWLGKRQTNLPVEKPARSGEGGDGQRAPIRQIQWPIQGHDERFVVEDKNVATHLIRNALGGRDNDMVCALLTLPSPYSRRYRDDLTVEVIFFGEGDKSGNVVQNPEASAANGVLKAKL